MPDPYSVDWNLRRRGRHWRKEAMRRWQLTPETLQMVDGQLLWSREDRLLMLGMLLENVGVDAAVRLGDPKVWRDAVAALK
jgi:hypothetical protein